MLKPYSVALSAAATAGELAGIACEAALLAWDTATGAIPKPWPAGPVVDDETVFDEAAAEKYLNGGDCGSGPKVEFIDGYPYLVGMPRGAPGPVEEPSLTSDELVAVRQLIEERFGLTTPADDVAATPLAGSAAGEGPAPHLAPGSGAGHPTFTDAFACCPACGCQVQLSTTFYPSK